MKPTHLVLPTFLTGLVLASSQEPQRTLATRGEALPASGLAAASLAWGDVDGDGLADLLAIGPDGLASALHNQGGGRFEPFGAATGLASLPLLRSAAWQDHDADGALDLLFVSLAGELGLLRNDGGTFLSSAEAAGLPTRGVHDARWADDDFDGLADLIVFSDAGCAFYHNLGRSRFEAGASVPALTAPLASAPAGPPPVAGAPPVTGKPAGSPSVAPAGERGPAGGTTRPSATTGDPTRVALGVAGTDPGAGTPLGPFLEASFCAPSIRDAATGSCLDASSTPSLGTLHPLSLDLNVSPLGRVGVGTTSPTAKLHVAGGSITGMTVTSNLTGASLFTTSSTQAALRASGERAGFFDGSLGVGSGSILGDEERVVLGVDGQGSGLFDMYTDAEVRTVRCAAESGALGANLDLHMVNGTRTVRIDAEEAAGNGAQISLANANGLDTMLLDANTSTGGAQFAMQMVNGTRTVEILSEETSGNGGQITMWNANGTKTMELDANTQATGGSLFDMYDVFGTKTVEIAADENLGDGAQIVLRRTDGTASIVLDANQNGDGIITTQVLSITGGADLTESFDVDSGHAEPGSVLVIDPLRPGGLRLSDGPYDRRVAGVVSGANGVQPGLRLGQADVLDGSTPVALTGRVYVACTTENGPIAPGDLLTTSSLPGRAMRASDPARAFGAVLGKALSSLEGTENGLVLVLVGLQ